MKKWKVILMAMLLCIAMAFTACAGTKDDEKTTKKTKSHQSTTTESVKPTKKPTEKTTKAVETTTEAPKAKETTVLVYMVGSDLESKSGLGTNDILEMLAIDDFSDINIILQTGGCKEWKNKVVKGGTVQRFELRPNKKLVTLSDLGKIPMLQADSLSDFITYATKKYPANKYILVMWNHGGGIPIHFGSDELFPEDKFEDYEMKEALQTAGVHFETIAFDACNMSTLEIAYAIKDYADYMVAAENVTIGCGLEYTSWLNALIQNPNSLKYTEKMVDSYMADIRRIKCIGTMSVTALDQMDRVYEAYADYLASCQQELLKGNFAIYRKARSYCEGFESIDSIDLLTMVNRFETNKSAAVINAVVNAIRYTASDYAYLHGLAVYSPYNYPGMYYLGRTSFNKLYDDNRIAKFYDNFLSVQMSKEKMNYAQSSTWYTDEVVSKVKYPTYVLNTKVTNELLGSDYIIKLKKDDWNYINTSMLHLFGQNNDGDLYYYGNDTYLLRDSFYNMVIRMPQKWIVMNNKICSMKVVSDYWDESISQRVTKVRVYAYVNNEPAMIIMYHTENSNACDVIGYCRWDIKNNQPLDAYIYGFNKDDSISGVVLVKKNGKDTYNWVKTSTSKYADTTFNYSNMRFGGNKYQVQIEMENIYGTSYYAVHNFTGGN